MHPNSSPTPRVERRVIGAKTWRDCTGDVLAWDGTWLTVTKMPTRAMTAGARWRIDGTEYQQRVVEVSGALRVRLVRADV